MKQNTNWFKVNLQKSFEQAILQLLPRKCLSQPAKDSNRLIMFILQQAYLQYNLTKYRTHNLNERIQLNLANEDILTE